MKCDSENGNESPLTTRVKWSYYATLTQESSMGYHHFSIAERGQLDALYRLKWTTRQIAVHVGRHHSTIARDFRRGRQADGYDATHAHRSAAQRRQGACPNGKHTPLLADEITHRLQHT